ncbi:hypothetical protein SNE40_013669 [Patella caerulea]|uniref:Uncharacterized protein n=1 Tax=Patella caerulea TaxID=87958 RepID=A0AAN8JCS0_PATCE
MVDRVRAKTDSAVIQFDHVTEDWTGYNLTHDSAGATQIPNGTVMEARYKLITNVYKTTDTENVVLKKCSSVLNYTMYGQWNSKTINTQQKIEIGNFLTSARLEHGLPPSLERQDTLCGNVTFPTDVIPNLKWFRALCDPEGEHPCCVNNQCSSRTVTECQCETCFDMRQPLHAEYSEWLPREEGCRIKYFNQKEACDLLNGVSLFLVGDSLIRHLYTALVMLLRNNLKDGAISDNAPTDAKRRCSGMYIFSDRRCRVYVDDDIEHICNGHNFSLKFFEYYSTHYSVNITQLARKNLNKPKTILLVGVGLHDNLNFRRIQLNLLQPLLNILKYQRWPKFVWATPHSAGILKTDSIKAQSRSSMVSFIREIEEFLKVHNIPVFNTFNLTKNVMSFDGTHYGLGINLLKSQILLNYIKELRDSGSL